ncbi:hypothetical protein BC835DRAFT_1415334 [Cytidiella melzeri]|nr:hypothetical protein BC835DRAFT_1415334 [Cytidiella melzeri]
MFEEFFVAYQEDNFGWQDSKTHGSGEQVQDEDQNGRGEPDQEDEESNSDEVNINGYWAPSWEPQMQDSAGVEGLMADDPMTGYDHAMEEDGKEREEEGEKREMGDDTRAQAPLHQQPIIKTFGGAAGVPVIDGEIGSQNAHSVYEAALGSTLDAQNPYVPFVSKLNWEVGRWAKLRGPGQTAFTELLAIDEVQERLGLSYKNSRKLNNHVNRLPATCPRFVRGEVIVKEQAFDFYYRDIVECIKALFGDPEFAPHLSFVPEHHYLNKDRTVRLYHDMYTGKWRWSTQSAYPVYVTIGNLPKHIRKKGNHHGQILVGYLPTSHFEHITSLTERHLAVANVFHACMSIIVEPLAKAGIKGILMASSNGVVRQCHSIFSNYVGDYPEQVLVILVKYGECPTCPIPTDKLGSGKTLPRDAEPILEALWMIDQGLDSFVEACLDAGIKTVLHPFWEDLPYVNIYCSITPDVLHQLYQNLIKHLVKWLTHAFGAAELDARC